MADKDDTRLPPGSEPPPELPSGLVATAPADAADMANAAGEAGEQAAEVVRARAAVWSDTQWSPARTERLLLATKGRVVRRQKARVAAGYFAAAAAVFLLLLKVAPWPLQLGPLQVAEQRASVAPPALTQEIKGESKVIRFGDGSLAELGSATAELDVERVSSDAIDVNLNRGRGSFRVTPNRARVFTVRAGEVMVTVLGTEFEVEKRGARTWVKVTRGKVSVDWPGGGNRLLLAGDEGQFPPEEPKQLPLPSEAAPIPTQATRQPVAPPPNDRPIAEQYRDRATEQNFDEAYELMKASPAVVGSDPSELMLAADVARLSGHPAEAVPYLRRVLKEHNSDSRAPLAAFTLGRMYLGQLGSPGEAAAAFAQVRALAPGGPLAEDALAREVEARARAGEKGKAQELARQYLQTYPVGRRTAIVRSHGGID